MPNGQGGERGGEQRAMGDRVLQAFYNRMISQSFTVSTDWLDPSPFWNENPDISPSPKPKRPTRPVSAIFYPMVNECVY